MKTNEEIYCIRFNKCVLKDDIHSTMYTLGMPTPTTLGLIIPESIILNKTTKRIIIKFDNGTSHDIGFTEDVELFRREKGKTEENEKAEITNH